MATQVILNANTPTDPIQIIGDATVFPDGTFNGAHIRLELAPEEEGNFKPSEFYYDEVPKNLSLPGGAWVQAAVGNSQAGTSLSLTINTP